MYMFIMLCKLMNVFNLEWFETCEDVVVRACVGVSECVQVNGTKAI